jgi:hypothetical protein
MDPETPAPNGSVPSSDPPTVGYHEVPTNINVALHTIRQPDGSARRAALLMVRNPAGGITAWLNEATVDELITHLRRVRAKMRELGPGLIVPAPLIPPENLR